MKIEQAKILIYIAPKDAHLNNIMSTLYSKGSEWRKWDLHIHTPASILYNEFPQDWDEYVKILFSKAIEKDIYGIGITDYYTIEGYKKIKKHYLENEEKLRSIFTDIEIDRIKQIVVIPNIEFRIKKLVIGKQDISWNRKVNFHVLFSDKVLVEDIEDFLQSLTFETEFTSQQIQNESLTPRNIEKLGKRIKASQSSFQDKSDIYTGMINVAIDEDDIIKALSSRSIKFKGNYLFGLPADEDLSLVNWGSQGYLERRKLFQKSSFCFSSNQNTRDFWLGNKHESEAKFIEEFNAPKPCIWGSDAHTLENLFEPDEKRYTWIKGDPTFEGLKQVILEPASRVLIQPNLPNGKISYNIINKVKIIDNTDSKRFSPNWINFNDDLNVVIGGKSSGKSLLLYHIAKAIDFDQVKERVSKIKGPTYSKLHDNIEVEVHWKSGTVDKLSTSIKHGKLTYLPQLYINSLAEEEGQDDFFKLIHSILCQNESYKEFDASIRNRQKLAYSVLSTSITGLQSQHEFEIDKLNELNEFNSKKDIQDQIESIDNQINILVVSSNLSEEELAAYEKAQNKTQIFKNNIDEKQSLIKKIDRHILTIDTAIYGTNLAIEPIREEIQDIDNDDVTVGFDDVLSVIKDSFDEYKNLVLSARQSVLDDKYNYEQQLNLITKSSKFLFDKVENSNSISILRGSLELEHKKLKNYIELEKEINDTREEKERIRREINKQYLELMASYRAISDKINTAYQNIASELTLTAHVGFNIKAFGEKFFDMFDKRTSLETWFGNIIDKDGKYSYTEENHINNIKTIFSILESGSGKTIKLKSQVSRTDLLVKLFEDYFKIEYVIEYKGDDMTTMSPGKRGLVLLQLILHISNSSYPILIDQPEDNLDNRTVYNELKQFIKDKKAQRQIVLVTHNANLVVSTDAENVIVSNQDGQQAGKENREFKFEYISGSLENTFFTPDKSGILYQQGIREHVCEILEGGKEAFLQREKKYGFL